MPDDRALRDRLESLQTETRRLKAQLAQPLESARIEAEVASVVGEAAERSRAAREQLEGESGLRERVESRRQWSMNVKSKHAEARGLLPLAEAVVALFLVFATAWSARLLAQALTGLDVRLALALAVLAGCATVWQVARLVRKLLR